MCVLKCVFCIRKLCLLKRHICVLRKGRSAFSKDTKIWSKHTFHVLDQEFPLGIQNANLSFKKQIRSLVKRKSAFSKDTLKLQNTHFNIFFVWEKLMKRNVCFEMCLLKTKCAFWNVSFENVPFEMCLLKCAFWIIWNVCFGKRQICFFKRHIFQFLKYTEPPKIDVLAKDTFHHSKDRFAF